MLMSYVNVNLFFLLSGSVQFSSTKTYWMVGTVCQKKLDILVSNYSLCSIKYKNECFKKKKKTKCWRFKDREGTSSLEELKCFVEEVEVELGFGDWVRFLWTEM